MVPWAMFSRGDEFYVAQAHSESAARAKISFHSDGIWRAQGGPFRKKLVSNYPANGNWISALHVHFLIPPHGATRPVFPVSPRAIRVEVPLDYTLHIDVFVSRTPPGLNADGLIECPVTEQAKTYFDTLRSGNMLVMSYRVDLTTDSDQKALENLRTHMPPLNHSEPVQPGRFHFELISVGVYEGQGNHALVTPTLLADHKGPIGTHEPVERD